jgi:hypothetical protein
MLLTVLPDGKSGRQPVGVEDRGERRLGVPATLGADRDVQRVIMGESET